MRRNHSLLPNVLTTSVLLGTAIALALTTPTANAEVITVCWDGSGDYLTIQEGIDAASDGDEVVVCDGVYTGAGNKNLDFAGKAITVRSENGPESCIIDCENDGRGFHFHNGETPESVVDGFTVTNGHAEWDGGGVYCDGSSPTIANCTITGNTAVQGGGGVRCYESDAVINNCTVTANTAGWGGGIRCYGDSPRISNCTITANTATENGGGVYCDPGSLTVFDCTIIGNTAYHTGGGFACEEAVASISNCTIAENTAFEAGGLSCRENGTIINCTITGNTATKVAGGVACGEGTTIVNCAITANTAVTRNGGGLACSGHVTIMDCTLTGNRTHFLGGAIYCWRGSPTIINCVITDNEAEASFGARGGGVFCTEGSPIITNCTIAENHVGLLRGTFAGGAGVYCADGSPIITNCTITRNHVRGRVGAGAGVSCAAGELVIANCRVTANTLQDGIGGAVYSIGTNTSMMNCTIAANAAANGRALACDSYGQYPPSNVAIANCILWNGGDEIWNIDESTIAMSYSDVFEGWPGAGNIDADPLFVDPDGPDDDPNTWEDNDYHLSGGSPCIDAGCNWAVPPDSADLDDDGDTSEYTPFDLDSEGRFFDDPDTADTGCGCPPIVDMGAYEFGETGPQPCLGDLDCDREVGHSDLAILLAAWHSSADGDLNCDGDTNHADLGILLANWGNVCP